MALIGILVFLLGIYKLNFAAEAGQQIVWAGVVLLGVVVFAAGLTDRDSRRAR